MKRKVMIGLLAASMAVAGIYHFVGVYLIKGDPYFVQITTDGERFSKKAESDQTFYDYRYQLTGYDENGTPRKLEFSANRERPLRKQAYLKVSYNTKKDAVTQWEEVKKENIPKKAWEKLN